MREHDAASPAMLFPNPGRAFAKYAMNRVIRTFSLAAKRTEFGKQDDLRIEKNVSYDPAQPFRILDIYAAKTAPADAQKKRRPVLVYLHGGGFRILSKDTHWMFAHFFARAGFVVFVPDYRLAPKGPFPKGLEDCSHALAWVHKHAERFGGDPSKIVLAGESAGGNLSLALACAQVFDRNEPFVQASKNVPLVALVPYCGMLDITNPERYWTDAATGVIGKPNWKQERISIVCKGYLEGSTESETACELASPLRILESEREFSKPLPPVFSSVGTSDPIYRDTQRLEDVLSKRGVRHRVTHHIGEGHAFQAIFMREEARRSFRFTLEFLRSVEALEGLL